MKLYQDDLVQIRLFQTNTSVRRAPGHMFELIDPMKDLNKFYLKCHKHAQMAGEDEMAVRFFQIMIDSPKFDCESDCDLPLYTENKR